MVYTEPVNVEELIERIERKNDIGITKSILIVGCSVCANISCSYYREEAEPAMSIGLKPLALAKEIEIISPELKKKYDSVDSINIKGLCGISEKSKKKIASKAKDADTIIVMSCPGGLKAVESYFDNKKLVVGMDVKGFKSPKIKFTMKGIYAE